MIESLEVQKEIQIKEPTGFNIGNQSQPGGVTVDEADNLLFVVESGTNTLSVINGSSNEVVRKIKVGELPNDLAFNSATGKIYVANIESNDISVIKRENNNWTNVKSIIVDGSPVDVVADPVNNRAYVAVPSTDIISVIDGDEDKVVTDISITDQDSTKSAQNGMGIAFNEFTNMIYVANPNTNLVTVIDGRTQKMIANISSSNMTSPMDIALDAISGKGYVADYYGNKLFIIDLATNSIAGEISVGFSPNIVAVNPGNHLIYVTNGLSNSLSIIDPELSSNIPVEIETDSGPFGVAVNPRTNLVYVTNTRDNTINIINGTKSDHPQQIYYAKFSIHPLEGGSIICDGKQIDTTRLFAFTNSTTCEPIPNNGFEFSSWAREIGSNATRTVPQNDHREWLTLVSLLAPKNSSVNISENDKYTATFIKTQELKIPEAIWITLFGIIASLFIPAIVKWFYGRRDLKRHKRKLNDWRKKIDTLYSDKTKNYKSRLDALSSIKTDIAEDLSNNELGSLDSDFLKSLISNYESELEKQ